MKSKLSNVLIAVQALAAACMIGAVKVWAPVCGKLLQLVSGKEVPMKCFYSGQAAIGIAIIMLVIAVLALVSKKNYKPLMIANAAAAVVLFLIFTSLIGVCASQTMRCQTTALWGKGVAAVVFAASLIELIMGKEGQIPD